MAIGLTELQIFRGTYRECMAKETRDMMIYLAWDTQEIFVGNSRGVKVRYGSSKRLDSELQAYFNQFKNEIYVDVNNFAEKSVAEKIKNFENDVNKKLEEFEKQYENKIDSLEANINKNIEDTVIEKTAELSNKLSNIEIDINNLKKVNKEVNDKINLIDNQLISVESRLSSLENIKPEESSKCLKYMTGDEISQDVISLGENISLFSPKFCTADSLDKKYTAGSLYYYKDGRIVSVKPGSGAPASKTKVDAEFSIVIDIDGLLTKYIEISNEPFDYSIKAECKNINAIKSATLKLGSETQVLNIDDKNLYEADVLNEPRNGPREIEFVLDGVPMDEDEYNIYSTKTVMDKIIIYIPLIILVDGIELQQFRSREIPSSLLEIPCNTGSKIEFLSPKKLSGFKIGKFGGGTETNMYSVDENFKTTVNGVDTLYTKYTFSDVDPINGVLQITIIE